MISVIVPIYNVEQYLQRCVESLLNQDISLEYEIILVNDGSSDDSGILCDRLQTKYGNVRVMHKVNGGLSDCRNYGVRFAKGEWITFVDSDDYVSEDYLSKLYHMVKKFNADMAVTNVTLLTEEESKKTYKNQFDEFCLGRAKAFLEIYISDRVGWSACGKLFRKDHLIKHPFPEGFYEDSATMYLLIQECNSIAFGDYRSNYHYIRREGSITASKLSKKHFRIFEVCDEISNYISNTFPDSQYMSTLIYQNAVLQLLNRIEMNKKQFNKVFIRYRSLFRNNILQVLFEEQISVKSKYYTLILSTTPFVYKIQRKVLMKMKSRKTKNV